MENGSEQFPFAFIETEKKRKKCFRKLIFFICQDGEQYFCEWTLAIQTPAGYVLTVMVPTVSSIASFKSCHAF